MRQTTTQRLASILVGQPIEDWIASRRADSVSWRKIALELHERTGGQVSVTGEAIRLWLKDDAA